MADVVPSIRFKPDDPRPVGFVESVDSSHLAAARSALGEIGQVVEEGRQGEDATMLVRFSSVRYMPTLPFTLYGFHILDVDDQGEFVDETMEGHELTYALVANQAIEVQREVALLFLYELVYRKVALSELLRERQDGRALAVDLAAADADQRAQHEFRDRIRNGWQYAARAIATRAREVGSVLSVRYETDPLPTRTDVTRRMAVLRNAYNEIDVARESIDKQVSMIGGRDPRLTGGGLTKEDEDKLNRYVASLGMRLWMSQTIRDAEVCGNGYLATAADSSPAMYALRPEDVEIAGESFLVRGEPIQDHVLHIRGIDQFESPYGISMLEPLLAEYRTRKTFTDAVQFAEQVLRDFPEGGDEHQWAQSTVELARRSFEASDERLRRLLWFPRDWLANAREGLYFPGQERM